MTCLAEEKRTKYLELVKKDKEFQEFFSSFEAEKAAGAAFACLHHFRD